MAFHVGQKVVCVDARAIEPFTGAHGMLGDLALGSIYSVASISRDGNGVVLHLNEILRPSNKGYYAVRFRPVIERKTDISIFTAMLTPNRVNA